MDISPKAENIDFAICCLPFYAFREILSWNHTPNVAFYYEHTVSQVGYTLLVQKRNINWR